MTQKTIAFLPGTLCDERLYAAQVEHFENLGWTTHVPQIRWQDGGIGAVAAQLTEALPTPTALVGLSLGGIMALTMLRHDRKRFSHLALFDTNMLADTAIAKKQRDQEYATAKRAGLQKYIEDKMLDRYLHFKNLNDEALRGTIVSMAVDTGIDAWRGQLDLLATRLDGSQTLAEYDGPTLIACGEHDKICTPNQHARMAAVRRERFLLIANSGHLPTLENPQAVNAALETLLAR